MMNGNANGKKINLSFDKNIVHPKTVFLDVRPPLENQLTEDDFLKNLKIREAFTNDTNVDVIYENIRPVVSVMRFMGAFPIRQKPNGFFSFRPVSKVMLYCILIYMAVVTHVVWILMQRIKIKSADGKKTDGSTGKFEEAVIAYLFIVYLLPIFMIPILWYETGKVVSLFNDWKKFEDLYREVTSREIPVDVKQKSTLAAILLPILSILCCVVIHITMIDFKIYQVLPYCFLTIITYILGGFWYLTCEIIGETATILSDDFHQALKNIGPASYVAEYRALWLRLSNLTRDTGIGLCYSITFLSLYLFLAITLSIYGLLSQIQEGLGMKDIGLTLTALSSIGLLFYLCDEAHYASQNISMFLKATDLNPTNLSVGGFFDVNRNLFKSLLATMVTYLVVLLQFQISIPDAAGSDNSTLISTTPFTN